MSVTTILKMTACTTLLTINKLMLVLFVLTASDHLFFTPMDWLLNCTNHCGFLGTTIGTEPFTDLDFADDVALLTEMLSVLILALEIVDHKSKLLGLQINWSKTKIQSTDASVPPGTLVPVAGDNVEVIESFTYLGVNIHNTGFSEHDIRKRIAIARNLSLIHI